MASYVDLLKTNYPNSIDERVANQYFKANINYEDRTTTTDPKDYYVLADDVNAVQEAIIAIERTLGIMPQGDNISSSIADRLTAIENFIVKSAAATDGHANLDQRYMWGGLKPAGLAADAKLSIKYHLHDGTSGGAAKINLTNHVAGQLKKNNIDLSSATADMLTAADIRMSTSSTQTITDRFADKLNVAGGIIQGNLAVKGFLNTRSFAEFNAIESDRATGTEIADAYADCGNCRIGRTTDNSGTLMFKNADLRYGNYVMCLRAKVASNVSTSTVAKVYVRVGGVEVPMLIRPMDFKTSNDYQMLYLEFANKNLTGSSLRPLIDIGVHYYNGITDLSLDSVVITPIHTAVYDDAFSL